MSTSEIIETIQVYMAAWNADDTIERRSLLDRCWAESGRYVDPGVAVAGRSNLDHHITAVRAGRPGARLEFVSAIDGHHDVARFLWRLVRADGEVGPTCIDFAKVDAEGRLTEVVGFFGAPPTSQSEI